MKKVGKIKLNQFGQEELDRRKLNALKGGCGCTSGGCGCDDCRVVGVGNHNHTDGTQTVAAVGYGVSIRNIKLLDVVEVSLFYIFPLICPVVGAV